MPAPTIPLRDRVLELLAHDGKPVSVRDLVRRLGLAAEARRELTAILRRLLEDGELVKIRGTRIGLPSRMNLVVGRLTCNPAGFGFVVPESRRPGQSDVAIRPLPARPTLIYAVGRVGSCPRRSDLGSSSR